MEKTKRLTFFKIGDIVPHDCLSMMEFAYSPLNLLTVKNNRRIVALRKDNSVF